MIDPTIGSLILLGLLLLIVIWRGPRSPSLIKVLLLLALSHGLKLLADLLHQRELWFYWVVMVAAMAAVVGAIFYVPSAWRESRALKR